MAKKETGKDPIFGDVDDMFHEMEKMMDEELKNFTDKVPKEYVKERKLPDGSTVKELGPFVYGYSMKIGPDGKPEIQEFGNVKKGLKGHPRLRKNVSRLWILWKQRRMFMWLWSCRA